ncbi:MAG: hypothetical protein AAGB93_18140 [Planctomycetota bacterium]
MKTAVLPLALLGLTTSGATAPQSSGLCPGSTFDPRVPGLVPVFGTLGVNGDHIVVAQSGSFETDGGPGGAKVVRVDAATGSVVPVDEIEVPGIGFGFSRQVLGGAVASSGAVLVARSEPWPLPTSLFQLRRTGPAGNVAVTSLQAAATMTWAENHRRFVGDGDRAVSTSWSHEGPGITVALDFFAVDAAGDWFLEDTVRVGRVATQYWVYDVRLRGDQALLEYFDGGLRAAAFQRQPSGRWVELDLPAGLAQTDLTEIVLDGARLATAHRTGNTGRVDLYQRSPAGTWALTDVIPVEASAFDENYPAGVQLAGDLVSFGVARVGGAAPASSRTRVYRLTNAGGFVRRAELNGALLRLTPDYAILPGGEPGLRVLDVDALVGEVRNCNERGTPSCLPQRGGDLHLLALVGTTPEWDLVLESAPAGVPVLALGSTVRVPPSGMLDSLCIGSGAGLVRLPEVRVTGADGAASWRFRADELPLAAGGTMSGIGTEWTFQALLRSVAGPATSRAITAQL